MAAFLSVHGEGSVLKVWRGLEEDQNCKCQGFDFVWWSLKMAISNLFAWDWRPLLCNQWMGETLVVAPIALLGCRKKRKEIIFIGQWTPLYKNIMLPSQLMDTNDGHDGHKWMPHFFSFKLFSTNTFILCTTTLYKITAFIAIKKLVQTKMAWLVGWCIILILSFVFL